VQLRNLARADAVIAPSRFLARMFEQNGFAGAALRIVPYGLEPDRIVRAEVARPRAPLRLAFAGVLSPWKGVHVAVEAVRRIRGPLELTVHGRTREGMFQVYIDGVLARAAGDERIRFPGPFDRSRASSALAAADLLIVPSLWYENTPFVILEAFAAGVPVAASDLGGMREIVEPGVNGFLFPPGDVDALAALLSSLRDEPARLASLTPRPPPDIAGNYDAFRVCYAGA
jgi:glycosyltransferase involved in cell wall biosynthesis